MTDSFGLLLDRAARYTGQRVSADRFDQLGELDDHQAALDFLRSAWKAVGLIGKPSRIARPNPSHLPFLANDKTHGWFFVLDRSAHNQWRCEYANGDTFEIESLEQAESVALPQRGKLSDKPKHALGLVRDALWMHKGIFFEAIVATGLINLLALGTSLYAMQIFDRVIPNQGFQTLWVLSVGVALAITLELILKLVRSHMVDRTTSAMDHYLTRWFFHRMLNIRMEARPTSVGTLASQIKGFDMVRGAMTSTSLFVLADIPFAIFFVFVIYIVGGEMAYVLLVAIPIALLVGMGFQIAIRRHTKKNLAGVNKKTGLLVEAVDGAETLKSSSAEWKIQGRWAELIDEVTTSDRAIRSFTTTSQHITVALQQFSYMSMVALGAWMATENLLTMGGLLACTIISNRAMMPVVQLPGVMVQWAHAKAAIEGLNQIIDLPNEIDNIPYQLAPQRIAGDVRFEKTLFVYPTAQQAALEIPHLEIKAGERVGIIGPVGSGKSTLLKLSSGLYKPNEGKLFLGNLDMTLLAPAILREAIAYVPQEVQLFSGTLRDNLLFGLADPGDEKILAAATQTGLIDLIAGQPKGLDLPISEGGRGVSGGQKQLIGLTRVCLAKPQVWILDEPTGSMDSENENRIIQWMHNSLGKNNSLIVATHKMALLKLLDRLVVLQNGHIIMDGPKDKILAQMSAAAKAQQGAQT